MTLLWELLIFFSIVLPLVTLILFSIPGPKEETFTTPSREETPSSSAMIESEESEPLDIRQLTKEQLQNLVEKRHKGYFVMTAEGNQFVLYENNPISFVQFSPLGKQVGFYYEVQEEVAGRDIVLVILDLETKRTKELYHGDYHTSSWEWNAEKYVTIRRGCGTECLYARMIDVGTGKEVLGYHMYDPPQWLASP